MGPIYPSVREAGVTDLMELLDDYYYDNPVAEVGPRMTFTFKLNYIKMALAVAAGLLLASGFYVAGAAAFAYLAIRQLGF